MSTFWSNVIDNKPIDDFLVENQNESDSEWDYENQPLQSEDGKTKDLQKSLNSNNNFLLSLVTPHVVHHFNLFWMSWYKSMKPLRPNLKLVIKKQVCVMHAAFTDIESSSNYFMLNGMSTYFLFCHFEKSDSYFIIINFFKHNVYY